MFPALCPSYQTWKICNAFNVKMHNYEKQVKTDYFCCITCPDEYKNLVQEKKNSGVKFMLNISSFLLLTLT